MAVFTVSKCAWCGAVLRRKKSRGMPAVSHSICGGCKEKILSRYRPLPAVIISTSARPSGIIDDLGKLDEEVVKEEIGLERDIERMFRRLSYIGNKHEKHAFLKTARRVISMLSSNRFAGLRRPGRSPRLK